MLCCEPIGMSHQTKTVWVYPNAGVPTEIPKVLRLLSIRTPRKVGLEIQQCQPFNCGLTKKGGRKQSRPTMNKPPTFKGLNIWILTIIPTKGRGFIDQGSGLVDCLGPRQAFYRGHAENSHAEAWEHTPFVWGLAFRV